MATSARAEKSTIVRTKNALAPRLLRLSSRTLNALAPGLAARYAERLFLTPWPRYRPAAEELALLADARPDHVRMGRQRLQTWSWGRGPAVLLVHGWGGSAAQLAPFVRPLRKAGFAVVAFDAPAHGLSDGRQTALVEFADAVQAMALAHGPFAAVVAHSMAGAATAYALSTGLTVPRAVFLAPPADLRQYSYRFARQLGFSATVHDRMQSRIERRYQVPWEDLETPRLARAMRIPLLVILDRLDLEVPWEDGATIADAWPGAELLTTSGLGHRRLVRDPEVIARAVSFVARDRMSAEDHRAVVENWTELAWWERPGSRWVPGTVSSADGRNLDLESVAPGQVPPQGG